jgi:hypothetical protein
MDKQRMRELIVSAFEMVCLVIVVLPAGVVLLGAVTSGKHHPRGPSIRSISIPSGRSPHAGKRR